MAQHPLFPISRARPATSPPRPTAPQPARPGPAGAPACSAQRCCSARPTLHRTRSSPLSHCAADPIRQPRLPSSPRSFPSLPCRWRMPDWKATAPALLYGKRSNPPAPPLLFHPPHPPAYKAEPSPIFSLALHGRAQSQPPPANSPSPSTNPVADES